MFGIAVVGFFWRIAFRTRVEGVDRIPPSGPAIILSAGAVYVRSILFGTRGVLIDLLGSGRHRAA